MDFLSTITNPANILEGLPPQLREAAAVLGAGQFWPQGNPEQFLERANAFLAYAQRCEVAGCSGDVRGAVAALDGKMKAALLARWEKLTSDDPRSHLASKIREAYLLSDVSRNQGLNIDGTKLEITLVVAWWLIQFITLIALALWLRSPSHRKKIIELLAKTGLLKAHLNHKKRMAEVFFPLLLGKEVVTESLQEGATQLLTQKIQAWNGTRGLVGFAGKKYGEVSTDWQQIDDAMFWGAIGGAFGGLAQGWFMQAVAAKMRKSVGDASFEGDLGRLFHPAFATKLWAAQALDQGITQGVVNAFLPVAQGQPFKVENLLLGFASGVFTGGSVSGVTQHVAGQLETAHAENEYGKLRVPPETLRTLGFHVDDTPTARQILDKLYKNPELVAKLQERVAAQEASIRDPFLASAQKAKDAPVLASGSSDAHGVDRVAVAERQFPLQVSATDGGPQGAAGQPERPANDIRAAADHRPTPSGNPGSHSVPTPGTGRPPAETGVQFVPGETATTDNRGSVAPPPSSGAQDTAPADAVAGGAATAPPAGGDKRAPRAWERRDGLLEELRTNKDPNLWQKYEESAANDPEPNSRTEVRRLLNEIAGPDFLRRTGEAGGICVDVMARFLDLVDAQFGSHPDKAQVHRGMVHAFVHAYHQGLHTRGVMQGSLAFGHKSGLSDFEMLATGIAAASHDVVQNHGRGTDEHTAAALAAHAVQQAFQGKEHTLRSLVPSDFPHDPLERLAYLAFEGVRATTFDENARTQSVVDDGDESSHRVQVAVATGDLLALCQQDGPYMSLLLSLENLSKKDPDNPEKPNLMEILLQRESLESVPSGEHWKSPYDIFGIIDELASEGNSQLRDAVIADLRGSLEFYDREKGHKFPDERVEEWWTGRDRNRRIIQHWVRQLENGATLQYAYRKLEEVAFGSSGIEAAHHGELDQGFSGHPDTVQGRPGRPHAEAVLPGPRPAPSPSEPNGPQTTEQPHADDSAANTVKKHVPVLAYLGETGRAQLNNLLHSHSASSHAEIVRLISENFGPCPQMFYGLVDSSEVTIEKVDSRTEQNPGRHSPDRPTGNSNSWDSVEAAMPFLPNRERSLTRRRWFAEYIPPQNTQSGNTSGHILLRLPPQESRDQQWTFDALCDWHRAVAEKVLVERAMMGGQPSKSALTLYRVQADALLHEEIKQWHRNLPDDPERDLRAWAHGILGEYSLLIRAEVPAKNMVLNKFEDEGRINSDEADRLRNHELTHSAILPQFIPENWDKNPLLVEKTQRAPIGTNKAQRALELLTRSPLVVNPYVAALSRHIDDFLELCPRFFSPLSRGESRTPEGQPNNAYTELLDLVDGTQTSIVVRPTPAPEPEPEPAREEPQEPADLTALREAAETVGAWDEIETATAQLPDGMQALFYAGMRPAVRHARTGDSTVDLLAAARHTIRTLRHPELGFNSAIHPFSPGHSSDYRLMIREVAQTYRELHNADLPWPTLKQLARLGLYQPRLLRKFWLITTDSRWQGTLSADSGLFEQVLDDHQTLAEERNTLEDVQLKFQLDPNDIHSDHTHFTNPARAYPERLLAAPAGAVQRVVESEFPLQLDAGPTPREGLTERIDPRRAEVFEESHWHRAGVKETFGQEIERRDFSTDSFSYLTEIDRDEFARFGAAYIHAGETADRYACDGAVFLVDELDDPESTLDILARAYRVNPELVARAVEARNRVAEGINLEESAREQLASLDKIVRKAMRLEQNEARGHLQLVHDRNDLDSTTRAKLEVIEPSLHPASDLQRDYLHTHIPGITEPNRNEIALHPWQLLAENPVDLANATAHDVATWADSALQRRTEAQLTEIARRTGVADRVNARLQSLSEAERGLFLERMAQKFLQYPYWLDPKHLAFNPDSATWHPDQDPASPMHSALDVEILSAVNAELQSLRHPDLFDARGLDTNFRDMEGDLLAWADNANTQQENPRRLDEDMQRAFREATTYLGKHAPERIRQFWLLTQQHGLSGTVQDNPALFAGAVIEAQLVETTRQTAEDGLTPAERAELAEVRNRSNVLHAEDRALRAKWPGRDIESVGERGALKNENAVTTVASWTRNGRKFLKAERADRTRTLEQLERTYFFNPDLVARALSARHQAAGTEPEIALTNPLTMQDAAGRYLLDQVDPRAFTGPEPRNAAEEAVLIRSVRQPRSLSSVDSSPESSGLLKDTPAGAYRVLAEKLAFFGTIRGIRRQLDGLDVLRGLWSELQDASGRHPLRVRFLPFTESSYASLIESRKLRDPFSEVAALADGEDLRSIIVAPDQGGTIFDLIPALVEQYFYPDPTVARNLKNELSTEQFWYYSLQNQKQREIYGKLYQRHALAEFLSHGPGAHEERLAIIQQFHSEFWNTREQALISPETVTRQSLKKYERKDQPGVYSADTHRFVQQLADLFTGKNVTDEAVLGAVADSPHRMAAAIWREKAATYGILNEFRTNPQLRWAYVDLLLDPETYRSPPAFRQLLRRHDVDPHERTAVPEGTSTPDTETIQTATSIQFLQRHLAENPATEEQVRLAKDTIEAAANRVLQNAHDTQEAKRKKATVRPGKPVNYDYKEHAFSEKLEKIQAEQELRENFLNQIYSELKKHFSEPGHLGAIDGPTAQRWNKQLLPEALLLDEFVDKVYRAQIPLNTALIGVKLAPADNDTPPRSPDTLAQRVVDLREAGRYISPPNSAALSMADLERHVDFLFSNALRMDKEWTQEIFELTMKRHEQFSSADDHAYLWFWLDRRFWAEPAWNTVGGNRPETPRVGMWHPPQQDAARDERPQDFPSWDKNASVRHLRTVSRFIDNAGLYQDDPAAFRRFVQEEALREFPDVPGLRRRFES